jgi:rod shape-determining protein MreD
MRQFFAFVLIYILFLLQTGFLPIGPDLVLLALVVFARHENKATATSLGFFAGLLFDLIAPRTLGIQILIFTMTGYGVSTLRNLLYSSHWQPVIFTFVALMLKMTALNLVNSSSPPLTLALCTGLTLILSPFAEPVLTRLFYRQEVRSRRQGKCQL